MSLRLQAGAPNHESRPLPLGTKKFGLLQRLGSDGITFRNHHTHGSSSNHNLEQPIIYTLNDSASSVVTSSSCNSLDNLSTNSSSNTDEDSMNADHNQKPYCSIAKAKIGGSIKSMSAFSSAITSKSGRLNIMHWMQNDCPNDVILLVLAFAGPQKIAKIGRINRFWRQLMSQESTWRHLCESLFKVWMLVVGLGRFPFYSCHLTFNHCFTTIWLFCFLFLLK